MEKRSLKLSASSAIDVMDDPEPSNTSLSGRDIRKVTTLGNQHHKYTLQISSEPTTASAR
jgi:hypothetical protein